MNEAGEHHAPAVDATGPITDAIARSSARLLALQHASGHWQAPLEGSAAMEAEYVFFNHLLGRERSDLERRVAERLVTLQAGDGGWPASPAGPSDLSVTAEAYVALRLTGMAPDEPVLARARDLVLDRGGLAQVGIATRVWLALLGQFPWTGVPALPVEIVLLPPWAPVSLEVFSRLRATIVPLALLRAHPAAARPLAEAATPELWRRPPRPSDVARARSAELVTLENLFLGLDRLLAAAGRSPWQPLRRRAVARAIEWVLRHQDANGQWGASLRATLFSVLALDAVGFAHDHPVMVGGLQGVDDFLIECEGTLVAQPASWATWDTALAAQALLASGLPPAHPALGRAGEWLLRTQTFRAGDWAVLNPRLEPGGWAPAAADEWYPDTGVSATVLDVLAALPLAATPAGRRALAYGRNWALGMQSCGGGYARFDVDNAGALPVPGLDTALDPPRPDVTGRVLELMAGVGYGVEFGRARRAVEFLRAHQGADGSWGGPAGDEALYATWCALAGLAAMGEDMRAAHVRRAAGWVVGCQHADGGWGDAAGSTPLQTAWACLGLLATDGVWSDALARGIDHLVRTQRADGGWIERRGTMRALPGRAGLRAHLHAEVYPLLALGRCRARLAAGS